MSTAKVFRKIDKATGKPKNPALPWTCRYWADGPKGAGTVQREKSFPTKKEADDFGAGLRLGFVTDPGSEPFAIAAQRWIDTRRPATRARYTGVLKVHLTDLHHRKLASVAKDRAAVQALVQDHKQGKAMLSIVRETCREQVAAGRLDRHFLDGITTHHASVPRDLIVASDEQIDAMAESLGDDGLIVHLCAGLGLRISEALALQGSDFWAGKVKVWRQRDRNGDLVPLKSKKDFSAHKIVPVPTYLQRMVDERGESGFLFDCTYSSFRHRFDKAAKAAGLPAAYSVHQLRHAFASKLLSGGARLDLVSKWMGHADTRETSRVYAHLIDGDEDRARMLLERPTSDGRKRALKAI